MQLDPNHAPWLQDPAVRRVIAAFDRKADAPRFVGGCVRNALIGAGKTDLDIAVLCPPETTIARLEAAGLRAIPTGLDHGTITTVAELENAAQHERDAGDKPEAIEITTLRKDVETDGRRAVVAFTEDWAIDAGRRDFTINALYAEPNGAVVDPLGGGVADLQARRIRFIGEADARIREDYLRVLRFFRFFAWYGRAAPEPADVAAIEKLKDGVTALPRERIGAETRKLFAAPDPTAALALMQATGADSAAYHTPLARSVEDWRALIACEAALDLVPRWERRLLFAYGRIDGAADLRDMLRLSKAETAELEKRTAALTLDRGEAAYRFGAAAALDALAIEAAAAGRMPDTAIRAEIENAASAHFPLTAKDLIHAGLTPGPALGAALKAAEARWIESGFRAPVSELITTAQANAANAS